MGIIISDKYMNQIDNLYRANSMSELTELSINLLKKYKNRMIRFMYKDIYLPIHCYASKKQFYSLFGQCACMTKCKFIHESLQNQDYRGSVSEKDRQ